MKATTTKERITRILKDLGNTVWDDRFKGLVAELETIILDNYSPQLMDGAYTAVQKLSEKYLLGIISDTGMTPGRTLRIILERNQLSDYFKCSIFSDEVGYYKPDSRIFCKALDCLGVNAEDAIHIGDFQHTDIRGAKKLGMGAILIGSSTVEGSRQTYIPDYHAQSHAEIVHYLYS